MQLLLKKNRPDVLQLVQLVERIAQVRQAVLQFEQVLLESTNMLVDGQLVRHEPLDKKVKGRQVVQFDITTEQVAQLLLQLTQALVKEDELSKKATVELGHMSMQKLL